MAAARYQFDRIRRDLERQARTSRNRFRATGEESKPASQEMAVVPQGLGVWRVDASAARGASAVSEDGMRGVTRGIVDLKYGYGMLFLPGPSGTIEIHRYF